MELKQIFSFDHQDQTIEKVAKPYSGPTNKQTEENSPLKVIPNYEQQTMREQQVRVQTDHGIMLHEMDEIKTSLVFITTFNLCSEIIAVLVLAFLVYSITTADKSKGDCWVIMEGNSCEEKSVLLQKRIIAILILILNVASISLNLIIYAKISNKSLKGIHLCLMAFIFAFILQLAVVLFDNTLFENALDILPYFIVIGIGTLGFAYQSYQFLKLMKKFKRLDYKIPQSEDRL